MDFYVVLYNWAIYTWGAHDWQNWERIYKWNVHKNIKKNIWNFLVWFSPFSSVWEHYDTEYKNRELCYNGMCKNEGRNIISVF